MISSVGAVGAFEVNDSHFFAKFDINLHFTYLLTYLLTY